MRSGKRGGAKMRTHLMLEKGTDGAGGRTPGDCSRVMFLVYARLKTGVFAIRIQDGDVEFFLAALIEVSLPGFGGGFTDLASMPFTSPIAMKIRGFGGRNSHHVSLIKDR